MNMTSPPVKGVNKAKKSTTVLPDGRVSLDIEFSDGAKITVFENLEHRPKWVQLGMESYFGKLIRLSVGVEAAKAAVQKARNTMEHGGFPGRVTSAVRRKVGDISDLAKAIAKVDHVSPEKVQEWLDQQEREQHGFKLRQRNNPRYMGALADILQGAGEGEKVKIDLH